MSKRPPAKKSTRSARLPGLSLGPIVMAIEQVEKNLQAFDASERQRADKEATLRFLAGIKEAVNAFCLPRTSEEIVHIGRFLAQDR